MTLRLHLGCGAMHLEGWTNIDRRYQPGVDSIDNIGLLQHVAAESVDEIYCCHAIDHFDRWSYKTVLRRWFSLLRPGGVLRISTPDFEWAARAYVAGEIRLPALTGHLYASQDYQDNVRHWIWDFRTAKADLTEVGFETVCMYDADYFLASYDANNFLANRPAMRDCSVLRDNSSRQRSLNVLATKAA